MYHLMNDAEIIFRLQGTAAIPPRQKYLNEQLAYSKAK
jgi:hypothetical protein